MQFRNCYATLDEFKAKFFPPGTSSVTAEDSILRDVIENICRAIDKAYGRHWYPVVGTRHFSASTPQYVIVEDLLSITTLSTDDALDRNYSTTWSASDYDLEPFDGPSMNPPEPYSRILVSPLGAKRFPTVRRGVKVVGTFGYYDVRRTATATVAEAVDTSETVIDVSDAAEFAKGQTVLIDSEQMHVQDATVNANPTPDTITVTRAANGTTAAAHDSGATIQIYEYPILHEVALLMAQRLHKRKDAIFGVTGSAEMGQMIAIAKEDPDVKKLMQPFVKVRI